MGKRYNINLLTEGAPTLRLEDDVSIGKFGQTINIDHPDISTKHCTFFLKDDVLSLKDHGSDKGTYVNGTQVPADQPIVITSDDEIVLGSIKVNIEVVIEAEKKVETPIPPPLPDLPAELLDDVIEVKESVEKTKTDDDKTVVMSANSLITEINEEKTKEKKKSIAEPPKGLEEVEVPSKVRTKKEPTRVKDYDNTEMANTVHMKTLKNDKVLSAEDETHAGTLQLDIKTKIRDIEWGVPYLIRLFAFVVDFNISIFITLFLIEHNHLSALAFLIDPLSSMISMVLGKTIAAFVPFVVVHFVVASFSNLIFKSSLGKCLLRISVEGKGVMARIKAFARSLLGFLLMPLVVFDVPALFSKPTVKEILCLSRFYIKSATISYFLALIFLPASFVLGFYTSFFERGPLSDFQSFEFSTMNIAGQAPSSKKIYSEYFHFEKPKRSRLFIEYPDFVTIRKKSKRYFAPAVGLYYPAEKFIIKFEKKPGVNLRKMLNYAVRGNPLASYRFPEIVKYIEGSSIAEPEFIEEIKNLFKASLELSIGTSFQHLLSYGPFFKSFFDFRDSLLSTIDQRIEKVQFMKVGGRHFAVIAPPSGKFAKENTRFNLLMPITEVELPILTFNFQALKPANDEAYSKFYRHFFTGINWDEDLKYSLSDKFGAYEIIDYFQNIPQGEVRSYHAQIFRFYYSYARRLVRSKNTAVRDDFIKKLNNFLKMIIGLNQKERKENDGLRKSSLEEATYDKLIKKINEVVEALKGQDASYFGSKKQ